MTLFIDDVKKIIEQQGWPKKRIPGQSITLVYGLPIIKTPNFVKKERLPDTASVTAKRKKGTKGTFQQSNKRRGDGRRMKNRVKSQYSCRNCSGYL